MISLSLRRARTAAATAALAVSALALVAQNTPENPIVVDWTGAADSNYLNPANWSNNAVPSNISGLRFPTTLNGNAVENRTINLNYTGTGDQIYQVAAIRTAANFAYNFNLSGSQNGWLIYNIVGRGTHPWNTEPNTTSTGNSANRLSFFMNLGPYTKITFDGGSTRASGATSGLTYAQITLEGNAMIDASSAPGASMEIGSVNISPDAVVYLGGKTLTISDSAGANREQVWAGRLYQDPTVTADTQKWGAGITRVAPTGVVSLPGNFRLRSAGQYLVDGVHNGPIATIQASSVLGGSGTINGAVTINSGTSLNPGGRNAIGHLTINGDITLNGAYSVDLFSGSSYDHLQLNGDLNIGATGNLAVGVADTFPLQPGTFRVLDVNGAINGAFSSVALPSSQGLEASYVLGSNYLDIVFRQLAFGTNPLLLNNHQAIALHIDHAVENGTAPGSLLDTLNRQPSIDLFRDVLDQLSPGTYQAWFPSAVIRTNVMVQNIEDRLAQSHGMGRENGTNQTFFQAFRHESSKNRTELATYSNYDTIAAIGGFDRAVGDATVAGLFFNHETTDFILDTAGGMSELESLTGGLYASHTRGRMNYHATAFVGRDDYDSSRSIARTRLGEFAESDTTGMRYGGSLSALYTYKFSWFEVAPTAGLQYLGWDAKAFGETGSEGANLWVKYQSEESLAARFGVRIARTFDINAGQLRPFLAVAWQHEFNSDDRDISANLFGDRMTLRVPGIGAGSHRIDAGVDWNVTSGLVLNARYMSEYGGAADESVGVRFGASLAF